LEAVERCRFDNIFTFVYSPRKGTPAAAMENQIPDSVAKERMARLLALHQKNQLENNRNMVGKTVRALCDGISKTDCNIYSAYSQNGKLIHFKASGKEDPVGRFVRLRITDAHAITLIGEEVL